MTTLNEKLAQSMETTEEIINAISELADSTRTIKQIWSDPTDIEFRSVIARADELLGHAEDEMFWGASTISVHLDADPTDFSARYDF